MIKRAIFEELKSHLRQKEISLLVGPRQAGKTTLMKLLQEFLEREGEKTLYLNLDFESDQPFFQSQKALIQKIELELGKQKGFIFIDEIQRKENAGLFLKGLYDYDLPYKFIVSGSGSVELKEKIHESLLGRKRLFEIETLSFKEFVNFKTDYRYQEKLINFFAVEQEKGGILLEEYLNFGGYPRVVLEETLSEKKKIMDEIYRSLLEKDMAYLLKVEKIEAFSHLIKILASQIGRIVNFSELSSTIGISLKTIENYFRYAQKTYIIEKLTPYFRNPRTEISKAPVVYFHDLGLRNYALGCFGNLPLGMERGFLFQNFIFRLLKEKYHQETLALHFWRTKDKAEVDFVLEIAGQFIPVEIKYTELKRPELGRSLRSFISRYKSPEAWVVNLALEEKLSVENAEVHILPFYALIDTLFVQKMLTL